MATKNTRALKVGDDAIKKATGKTWPQWYAALDKAGCRKMTHKEIVAVVHKKFGVGPWWQQMVTVGYEQARGLRVKHQTATGYSISRSKTLPLPIAPIFRAWNDSKIRARWMKDELVIRKATVNRSIRITWPDGRTSVEVMFYPKGASRSQVTVQHSKLPDAKAGEKMKAFWGKSLERMAGVLKA